MYILTRSNMWHTKTICVSVYRAFKKYPDRDTIINIDPHKTLEISRDKLVVKINDNEILCIYIVDNKFDVISISDGKAYDLHGCPLARTREILNGLFDMFEQIRVLPPLRVFFGKEGRPETFIGDGDENTLFGRNWSNKLYYKCFTKSAKPCRTESCNEADIPVWLAAKETRRVAKQVSDLQESSPNLLSHYWRMEGKKSAFCAMHLAL